ncbi:hypothetical protein CerSpe_158820 [Prunus speciosa]
MVSEYMHTYGKRGDGDGDAKVLTGVPEEVIKRAAFILEALGNNEHVERLCNENVSAKDQQYQNVVDKMLAFDFHKENFANIVNAERLKVASGRPAILSLLHSRERLIH